MRASTRMFEITFGQLLSIYWTIVRTYFADKCVSFERMEMKTFTQGSRTFISISIDNEIPRSKRDR